MCRRMHCPHASATCHQLAAAGGATYLGRREVRVADVAAVDHDGLGAATVQDGGVRDDGAHVLCGRVGEARVGVHVDVLLRCVWL